MLGYTSLLCSGLEKVTNTSSKLHPRTNDTLNNGSTFNEDKFFSEHPEENEFWISLINATEDRTLPEVFSMIMEKKVPPSIVNKFYDLLTREGRYYSIPTIDTKTVKILIDIYGTAGL